MNKRLAGAEMNSRPLQCLYTRPTVTIYVACRFDNWREETYRDIRKDEITRWWQGGNGAGKLGGMFWVKENGVLKQLLCCSYWWWIIQGRLSVLVFRINSGENLGFQHKFRSCLPEARYLEISNLPIKHCGWAWKNSVHILHVLVGQCSDVWRLCSPN